MKRKLRRTLEKIAHRAGVYGVIESIPDDVLEEAFLDFLSCPVCTGDCESTHHEDNPNTDIFGVVADDSVARTMGR